MQPGTTRKSESVLLSPFKLRDLTSTLLGHIALLIAMSRD